MYVVKYKRKTTGKLILDLLHYQFYYEKIPDTMIGVSIVSTGTRTWRRGSACARGLWGTLGPVYVQIPRAFQHTSAC